MGGIIFDIKHFAVHDGPGIRSTVFLKGCPLSCAWCHNPESIDSDINALTKEVKLDGRVFKKQEIIGKKKSVKTVIDELREYQILYEESEGGVSFSGGEPMLQIDFLEELLIHSKANGWHTTVDTSGQTTWTNFERILHLTDLFLFDLKHLSRGAHEQGTGMPNGTILKNLQRLCKSDAKLIIRIPVIPGFNFETALMYKIGNFLQTLGGYIVQIDLLPFHAIGRHKYEDLGMENRFGLVKSLNRASLLDLKRALEAYNFIVTIGA